jgi:AcrR family transcriptional regulator
LDTEADYQELMMARNPESPTPGPDGGGDRHKLIEAFMALLAERRFEELGFADLAARAGVSLAACRAEFGSMLAVLAAYAKEIDRTVLAGLDTDLADELPRERLFDVLMRRLEALAAHKGAIRSLMRSARRNPPLAVALNGLTVQSMQWMLTAADINAAGPGGALRAQGLALLYASALRTWVDDEDPGLARTMAALDRELARGARWVGLLDTLCRFAPSRDGARRRSRPDRTDLDEEPIPA